MLFEFLYKADVSTNANRHRHITQHLMLTFQNVSCLNCVHRQPCPHTGTQRIRRPHIDRIRLNDEKVVSAY